MSGARAILAAAAAALAVGAAHPAAAQVTPDKHWSFEGIFGTFDRAALQRGFQVYQQVCSTCHEMQHLAYRNLTEIGLSEDQAKKIAASVAITDGPNDEGKMYQRPGRLSDYFKPPFANEEAARAANNGALPPDLSMIVKAREGGPNHVYGVLTEFQSPPPPPDKSACRTEEDETQPNGTVKKVWTAPQVPEGKYYNAAMPGCIIAMPPPLSDGAVKYSDGTKATVPQMASDVATFLAWASEPEIEQRHRLGIKVVLFLFVMTGLMFALKKKIWKDIQH